jgi:hypothetical protein
MENVSEVFVANGVAPNNYTEYSLIQTIATLFDLYGTKIKNQKYNMFLQFIRLGYRFFQNIQRYFAANLRRLGFGKHADRIVGL